MSFLLLPVFTGHLSPQDYGVIALVSIRKVYEFVLHRLQNDVFIFHNCDRNFTRLTSVRYPRDGKPTFIADSAFADADFQQQLAFWIDRMPGR